MTLEAHQTKMENLTKVQTAVVDRLKEHYQKEMAKKEMAKRMTSEECGAMIENMTKVQTNVVDRLQEHYQKQIAKLQQKVQRLENSEATISIDIDYEKLYNQAEDQVSELNAQLISEEAKSYHLEVRLTLQKRIADDKQEECKELDTVRNELAALKAENDKLRLELGGQDGTIAGLRMKLQDQAEESDKLFAAYEVRGRKYDTIFGILNSIMDQNVALTTLAKDQQEVIRSLGDYDQLMTASEEKPEDSNKGCVVM